MAITVSQVNGAFQFSGRAYNPTEAKNEALEPYGMILHNYGLVLSLLPSSEQKTMFVQQIGNARFVRNHYLNDRIEYYKETGKSLSVNEYKEHMLPKLKEEFPFLMQSDKFALESSLENVDAAYKNFFAKRAKFPKFTSKNKPSGNCYKTKFTNNNIRVEMVDDLPMLRLPKVGEVQFILPAGSKLSDIVPPRTSILSVVIKRVGDSYTASLQLEAIVPKPDEITKVNERDILAADLGLKHFMVIGGVDGEEMIPNPRWIKLHERRLRRLQKSMSRKQYNEKTHIGSKNWNKARLKVLKEHKKIANQRKDFHHKLSRAIADSCDVFCCESLNIKGMVKNRHLSKAISSVGWSQFLEKVKYKMEWLGKRFIQVDRWMPSSQICSSCGYKNPEVKDLRIRKWTCPKCGKVHDRDINAKDNLLKECIRLLKNSGVAVAA